jgi:hypothetical protein
MIKLSGAQRLDITNSIMKESKMSTQNIRHGGSYDRGGADAYYGRRYNPHYFKQDTLNSALVEEKDMTADEIASYKQGYDDTIAAGDFKDWG